MDQPVTLHHVAARVGVSTRTVSRVVNDEGGFSEETRRRVLAAVDELGYRPNLLARGLITRRSGTVGLVGSSMTDPFFPELADGVQRAAREAGLTMFFASTDEDSARQEAVLESMLSHAVDGVILFPAIGSADQIRRFAEAGLHIVVVDETIEGRGVVSVSSDIAGGAERAVAHLRERGRRRIGMLADDASVHRRRETGYKRALAGELPEIVERGPHTAAGGIAATERLLQRAPDVDAVFAYNDLMALGAIRVLLRAGRTVPDDVAVVGFDNIDVSAVVTPSLTTINLDRERLGQEAVAHLAALREDPESVSPPTILPVELIVRESA